MSPIRASFGVSRGDPEDCTLDGLAVCAFVSGTGVTAVFLTCEEGDRAIFIVARTQDGKGLATRAELPGQTPMRGLVRTADESASRLVSGELEILGRDDLYEQVLLVASELAPSLLRA